MPGLTTYRAKRDFGKTPEPRGAARPAKGSQYVIQKHAARRLHYDLRLELDGVMLSWAITKGPSLVPGEKRLAIHVEDHPIEYNSFEGTIPQGEYGGGTVMIWDRGHWVPDGDPRKGLKKGKLDFSLEGEKLQGRWHLVRLKPRPGERQESWLLIKSADAAARKPTDRDILEEKPLSVVTGRSIPEIAAAKGRQWHSNRPAKARARAPRRERRRNWALESKASAVAADRIPGSRRAHLPDKPARQVVRETSAMANNQSRQAALRQTSPRKTRTPQSARKPASRGLTASEVKLTNPNRVYWEDLGFTKQNLADYYTRIWKWISPHLVDRPVALLRCPEGTTYPMFFPEARRCRSRGQASAARSRQGKRGLHCRARSGWADCTCAGGGAGNP